MQKKPIFTKVQALVSAEKRCEDDSPKGSTVNLLCCIKYEQSRESWAKG